MFRIKRSDIGGVIAVAVFVAFSSPVVAQTAGRKMALVIGNGTYASYPHLVNAVHDAEDLAATVGQLGFQVQLVRDVKTSLELDGLVKQFANRLQRGDLALLYYAGHGAQIERDQRPNYLIPVDFSGNTMADLRNDAYLASRAVELLEDSNADLRLVILDACRNNPFTRGRSIGQYRTLAPPSNIQRGTLIAYAAKETQVAIDSGPNGRNGLFTYHLMRELRQPGTDLLDCLRNVADAVDRDSAESQSPVFYGRYSGRYYLLPTGRPESIDAEWTVNFRFMGGSRADGEILGTPQPWESFRLRLTGQGGEARGELLQNGTKSGDIWGRIADGVFSGRIKMNWDTAEWPSVRFELGAVQSKTTGTAVTPVQPDGWTHHYSLALVRTR